MCSSNVHFDLCWPVWSVRIFFLELTIYFMLHIWYVIDKQSWNPFIYKCFKTASPIGILYVIYICIFLCTRELITGPLYYAYTITLCGTFYWRTSPIAIAAICYLCFGDGNEKSVEALSILALLISFVNIVLLMFFERSYPYAYTYG